MTEIKMPVADDRAVWATVFSSDDVAEPERVDYLRQRMGSIWGAIDLQRGDPSRLFGDVASTPFAKLRFSRFSLRNVRLCRSSARDRTAPFYSMAFPFKGRMIIRQDGGDSVLRPGSAYLVHNGEPGEALISEDYATLNVRIPVEVFRHYSPELPQLREWPLQHVGMAVLVRHFVRDVLQQVPTASPDAAKFLSGQLCDLVAFLLTDSRAALASDSSILRAHRARAQRYIEKNFDDLDLSPQKIAAACGISLSCLHKIFAAADLSIMGETRRIRLARARIMLATPQFQACSVSDIGTRCGFRSPQDFSRVFRQTFGESPTQYRTASGS
jgi:AraC-like DNA-binding protein